MKKRTMLHAFLAILLGVASATAAAREYRLASGGATAFRIVLPDDAIPAEKTAARELQEHLKQMTGADFAVTAAADFAGGPCLAVGFNPSLPEKLAPANYPDLGPEEFVIDADGDTILLAGGRPRGALYASYEFLERLGIRWFTPTETLIPSRPELVTEVEPERYTSPFRSRTILLGNLPTKEWCARNRLNSYICWSNPGEEYGYGVRQGPDMDNMHRFVSPSVFKDHPEWAAFVDGKRQVETGGTHNWGTCLSNAEFRKHVIACVLGWIRSNPGFNYVWLTSNDGSPVCECPECKALYDAHGGQPSAAQMILVNELADVVAKEYPGMRVKTLAYGWARTPPTNLKLADNVTVMYCAYVSCFEEIGYDETGRTLVQEIGEWKKIGTDFEVYLYSHPYNDFWNPAPCLYSQARNIKRSKDLGFKLINIQDFGFGTCGYGGEQADLRSWLFTRMTWRPDSDVEELIQDFCHKFYGPNAKDVLYAIHRTEEAHASGWRQPKEMGNAGFESFLDPKTIDDILARLQTAYDRQSDPVWKQRLGYILIPYLWADYWLGVEGNSGDILDERLWGVKVRDRERREQEGALIRRLLLENHVTAFQNGGPFNPNELRLPELTRAYPYVTLSDNGLEAVIVPGLMGKMTAFSRDGHSVIKPLWGHVKWQYPEFGHNRDLFNGGMPASFAVVSHDGNRLELEAPMNGATVRKTFEMKDGALDCTLEMEVQSRQNAQISHQPLFNLNPDVLGIYPKLHVQTADGWRLTELGRSGTFWYQGGVIDFTSATGRVVLVAESGEFAVEMTFRPEEIAQFSYMYDRYDFKPQGTGRIVEFTCQTAKAVAEAGDKLQLHVRWRLLLPDEFPEF